MAASLQTIIALAVVAVAATLLVRSWVQKSKKPGCGSEGCGAVGPEIKKLRAKLKG